MTDIRAEIRAEILAELEPVLERMEREPNLLQVFARDHRPLERWAWAQEIRKALGDLPESEHSR